MHPAFSVLVFTTLSGAGYGLLFLLGLGAAAGRLPAERWFGLGGLGLSLGLVTLGLLASTLHLKHPERAWRAFSQWRSSWLSREGVVALATYLPAGLFAVGWVLLERTGGPWAVFAFLTAAGAALTVYCTGQIYASLKPIRQWHNAWTVPLYLGFALMTGAVWLNAWMWVYGAPLVWVQAVAFLAILVGWSLKIGYWRHTVLAEPSSSIGTATGLGHLGQVRLLDPPHTEENYLMKEMGYRVARKHTERLRRWSIFLGGGLPLGLTLLLFQADGTLATVLAVLAAALNLLGALASRWLFFAEATHSVTLYYGARRA
jgi:DMSO reductase anchor subunit